MVASISLSQRKLVLSEKFDQETNTPFFRAETKYTYGLKKVNYPLAVTKFPELSGTGVIVGILDTGIDANHPDLKGKVAAFKNYINSSSTVPTDDNGHGSHVAGTIAGGNKSGTVIGFAPNVKLVIGKVFSKYGSSVDADMLKSMQWMADPDGNPATADYPKVINSSWNLDDGNMKIQNPDHEPFCIAINQLLELGTLSVFSAGNDGPSKDSIKIPGSCPNAITVASTDESDIIANTSSRGPSVWKAVSVAKPNLAAPGVDIYSVEPGNSYKYRSGTSMATPHVTGAVALLIQANPTKSTEEIRQLLYQGTFDLGVSGFDESFGFGRLDILRSLN